MTTGTTPSLQAIGMFVSGAPLRSPGPRGEQLVDTSFMIWINAGDHPVTLDLPENDWVQTGEVVLSTDADARRRHPGQDRRPAHACGRQSVVVLRET